jgi:hypothetical protein
VIADREFGNPSSVHCVEPGMEAKDALARRQEMPVDTKEDTHNLTTSVSYDNTSDVSVKKEVDNAHTLEYNVCTDGASGISMEAQGVKDKDIKVEHIAQTDCDSKMELAADIPNTGRPYPVLLVQVKQELVDVEGICPEHDTTVHRDRKLPGCIVSPADDTKSTKPREKHPKDNNEVPVIQEVDNLHQVLPVINTDTRAMQIDIEVKDVKKIKGVENEPTMNME